MKSQNNQQDTGNSLGQIGRLGRSSRLASLVILCALILAAWMPAAAQNCAFNGIFPTPALTGTSVSDPGPCPSVLDYFMNQGGSAITVAVADFNRDGIPDVVVAQGGSTTNFVVQLGNGDGTFRSSFYNNGCPNNCSPDLRAANFAITGDFNGDGNPDIAVGTANGYAAVYLGDGAGSFAISTYVGVTPCCSGPGAGAVGDFNGDGKLDLLVANGTTSPGTITVLLGNGDGTFQPNPTGITVGDSSNHPDSIVVGDFNHDGKLDFATVNYNGAFSSTISVVMGNGDGTFQTPVSYPVNTAGCQFSQTCETNSAEDIAAADFNHDGYLDLAVLNRNGVIAVFLNNGNGTFGAPAFYSAGINYNNGEHPLQLTAGDFNKDGNIDLAFVANQQSAVGVLSGNGDGTFGKSVYYVTDAGGYGATGVAAGDFNGDGNLDLVATSIDPNDLTLLLGNGDGSFKGARSYVPWPISAGFSANVPTPTSVAFGDFNGDGKPDMAVVDQNNGDIAVFLGNGDGSFTESANYHTGPYSGTVVAVADLNGDGKLDLLVGLHAGTHDDGFSVLLGNGDGTFQAPVTYSNGSHGGSTSLILADVNGDGKLDVVSGTENSGDSFTTATNESLFVNLGNGDGTFQAGVATPALCPGGGGAGAFLEAVADLNGDGKPDIAAVCDGNLHQSNIWVLLNNGDGTFGNPTQFASGETPVSISVGDFNQEGKMDLAVIDNWPTPGVSILQGNGDGTFQAPVFYSSFSSAFWQAYIPQYGTPRDPSPDFIVAADINQDGHLDLLVGNNQPYTAANGPEYNIGVQLFLGNGDGTFQAGQSFMTGRQATFLSVADLNGDGVPDLAAVDQQDAAVAILLNQSRPAVVLQSVSVSPSTASIAVGLTQQFTATGHYSDGSTKDVTTSVTWSSSNTSIATISNSAGSQGLATGVAAGGPVTITAALGSLSGTAQLTVSAAVLQTITVSPASASVVAGLTQQFTASGHYSDGSNQDITASVAWSSSNTAIATISNTVGSQGLAKGMAAGGAVTITAMSGAVSGTAQLTVTAAVLTSLAVSPVNPSVATGSTQQFTATGMYSDGTQRDITGSVTWACSNTAVATITAGGLASALSAGSTTISATQGSVSNSTTMTVIALQSLTISPLNQTTLVNATVQYTATGHYSDGSTRDLTSVAVWSSSKPTVATITSPGGLATGKSKGTTTIKAVVGAFSASTSLKVNPLTIVSVTVTPTTATIAVGGTQQFTATATYSDGSTSDVTATATWSSSSRVASVNSTGLATGKKVGTATISAKMGGATGSATLTVN